MNIFPPKKAPEGVNTLVLPQGREIVHQFSVAVQQHLLQVCLPQLRGCGDVEEVGEVSACSGRGQPSGPLSEHRLHIYTMCIKKFHFGFQIEFCAAE